MLHNGLHSYINTINSTFCSHLFLGAKWANTAFIVSGVTWMKKLRGKVWYGFFLSALSHFCFNNKACEPFQLTSLFIAICHTCAWWFLFCSVGTIWPEFLKRTRYRFVHDGCVGRFVVTSSCWHGEMIFISSLIYFRQHPIQLYCCWTFLDGWLLWK